MKGVQLIVLARIQINLIGEFNIIFIKKCVACTMRVKFDNGLRLFTIEERAGCSC